MNERIKLLAEQATVIRNVYHPGDDGHPTPTSYFDKEKFAELIIRECAEWMDAEQDEKGDGISDNFYWSARMRLHFGVVE